MIQQDKIEENYTTTGKISSYSVTLFHEDLNEYKNLKAKDYDVLEGKIHNQEQVWNKKWSAQLEKQEKADKEENAKQKTEEAKAALKAVENILTHTIDINDAVNWDSVKNTSQFKSTKTKNPQISYKKTDGYPETSTDPILDEKPQEKDFFTGTPFLKLIFGKKKEVLNQQKSDLEIALKNWNDKCSKVKLKFKKEQWSWDLDKKEFEKKKVIFNKKIDALRKKYEEKDADGIIEYCEIVLNNSDYPDSFPKNFDIQYNETNEMLLVDFQLPSVKDIPTLSGVKYIKSQDLFEEKTISHAVQLKLYDSAIYQILIRTIHELFEADIINVISSITLNGIVTDTNPATGHKETSCIASIQVQNNEFMNINLEGVDPKSCFKALKGVGSTKFSSMVAIRPILELDKTDKRFKDHYEVVVGLDSNTNLAAMDWEDFEHLIRELFEKEFASNGGVVKVTQASSDGGVDAIAFDPDPLRGGKIVIQAKRYTNTVGVAAVRDLYGTLLNEGATKGVLVTTSDFGADSYSFAKDKPITLLNGSNLLHLLEKHGHSAKIDIKAAKEILKSAAE